MGDMLTLIEEAHRQVDVEQARKLTTKVKSGKGFDLYDFKARVAPATRALVTYDLGAPEALEFADVHPDHTTVTLDYRGTPYYVLLAK